MFVLGWIHLLLSLCHISCYLLRNVVCKINPNWLRSEGWIYFFLACDPIINLQSLFQMPRSLSFFPFLKRTLSYFWEPKKDSCYCPCEPHQRCISSLEIHPKKNSSICHVACVRCNLTSSWFRCIGSRGYQVLDYMVIQIRDRGTIQAKERSRQENSQTKIWSISCYVTLQ